MHFADKVFKDSTEASTVLPSGDITYYFFIIYVECIQSAQHTFSRYIVLKK